MKRSFQMRLTLLAFTPLLVLTLSACRQNHTGGNDQPDGQKDGEETEKQIELVLWSVVTENDPYRHAFNQAIQDYEKTYTNVKILHEAFETEEYKEKIKDASLADELPDVFFSWGGEFSKPFVEEGRVMELDSYFNERFREELPEIALSNAIYDGRLFGVTYSTPVSVLFYNKKMFDESKLLPPETWEEWTRLCNAFIEKGIRPFGVSVKDIWVLAMYHDALTLKYAGPEKTYLTLTKGEGSYNDPVFLKPTQKLKEWMDMGAFIENAAELTYDEVGEMFYGGGLPMYVTGSWMARSIVAEAENPEDFWVAPIPVLNAKNAKTSDYMGGALDMLMVSENARNPSVAAEAVFELCKSISKYSYLDGVGIAAWKINYDDGAVPPIMRQIADYTASATSFTLWFDTLMETEDAGVYLSLLEKLYHDDVTPKGFVEAMANQLEK